MGSMGTTITADLRKLLTALLEGNHAAAWGYGKMLSEAIECAERRDGLPARAEVTALLAEVLAHELKRAMNLPPGEPCH